MARSAFVLGYRPRCGKATMALGLARMVSNAGKSLAVLRPVTETGVEAGRDQDLDLLLTRCQLDQPYERARVWTLDQAKKALLDDPALFFDAIIERYKELQAAYDFVLCLGADLSAGDEAFERALNLRVAAALGAPTVLVSAPAGRGPALLMEDAQHAFHECRELGVSLVALVVNRVDPAELQGWRTRFDAWRAAAPASDPLPLIYAAPEHPVLSLPSMDALRRYLGAEVLYGERRLDARVKDNLIGAMPAEAFLERLKPEVCVTTPGDRGDILLAMVAAAKAAGGVKAAGLVLTGGMTPAPSIQKLFSGWDEFPFPVLLSQEDTYHTSKKLFEFRVKIEPQDEEAVQAALGVFARSVDQAQLWEALRAAGERLTPELFEHALFEKARAAQATVVLPEGDETRILRAAEEIQRKGVARVILLGDPEALTGKIKALGLDLKDARIENPATSPRREEFAQTLHELRKHKGLTLERAAELMSDRTYFGTMLVYKGEAEGMVSGSTTTTAETIRPALEFVKTKPGVSIVSGVFFMCLKDRVLVYGDCAVNPDPTAEQLAQIAICSADTATKFGIEPRVALLSYSTGGSGKGADVDKVREAARLAKELAPGLALDGPLQYDAAADPVVAAEKLPGSPVAGKATVYIFPDLDTGNNTYKAVQRTSGAVAMGPVLQGLNKPVNDLSRGCTVKDIIYTVAITAIQSGEKN
jgi:phosphate acetyltransferase